MNRGCMIILIILICCLTLEPLILMLLWNWLAPTFWTAAPELTFWQSLGICILLSIIGGFFKTSNNK
jgi:hypothetical protein